MSKKRKHKHPINIPNAIVFISIALLAVSVIAEILIPTYKTNPLLYGLLGTIVGLTLRSANQ